MKFRKSLHKVREKVKHGLSKIGDKLEGGGADVGGKDFDRPALSLQSDGEIRGEESKASGEGDPAPRLAVKTGRGLGESSQSGPHLDPPVEVESGSGRGEDRADAPRSDVGNGTPTPSILRGVESEGM